MKYLWIQKKLKKNLIVFFNGWSMDENPFKFLDCCDFDVCMFYDYKNLKIEENVLDEINSYEQIYIVAWSMGVWAAANVASSFKQPKKSIAINGTLNPIDEKTGIAPKIYDFTLRTMSEEAKKTFWANMFLNQEDFDKFYNNSSKRPLENQTEELKSIKELCAYNKPCDFRYDSAIVGDSDKIFRTKNQLRFWSEYLDPKVLNVGHFPFYLWKSWKEVLKADEQ